MIDVKGNKGEKQEPTNEIIWWSYPQIYDKNNLSTLEICLCHTRAADNIRIKYESDRDGWVIEQASIFEWDGDDKICDPDWQEVAFIQAWKREEERKERAVLNHTTNGFMGNTTSVLPQTAPDGSAS